MIDVLAAATPTPIEAMKNVRVEAFVILDVTMLRIDQIAADVPYIQGHGMNVHVLTEPFGRRLCASPACPMRFMI